MDRMHILETDFNPFTLEQTVDQVVAAVHDKRRGWLCTVNVAILMMMRDNPDLKRFVDKAAWVVADGQPIVWSAPIFNSRLPERVTGVDLINEITRAAGKEGFRIYLLGANKDVVEAVSETLKTRFPDADICGVADGYFSTEESAMRAEDIRKSGAQILFVAMGVPRQEEFIEQQWDRMGVNVAIGIGGSFDVLAGLKTRAPIFLQRIGMEWFFRLIQEPRRLWKRYLTTNSRFLFLVTRAAVTRMFSAVGLGRQ